MPAGQALVHIIEGCKLAKRESQKELYKFFYGFAYSICMRYSNNEEDIVEIVNDGFLKIFKGIDKFTPAHQNQEISLKAWIKKLMIHTAIDHYRKAKKHYFIREINEQHTTVSSDAENVIDKLSYTEIMAIVQRLSPTYRLVFNLYVIDGFKHEEIAKKLNISVGASKSNLSKAKQNIQKMLALANKTNYESKAV